MGYHRAGFDVVGVDINPQPHYPFEFHQKDALHLRLWWFQSFDAIHASPVCKAWTKAKRIHGDKEWYPADQIPSIRNRMQVTGLPYVIENVVGAPLSNPFMLVRDDVRAESLPTQAL